MWKKSLVDWVSFHSFYLTYLFFIYFFDLHKSTPLDAFSRSTKSFLPPLLLPKRLLAIYEGNSRFSQLILVFVTLSEEFINDRKCLKTRFLEIFFCKFRCKSNEWCQVVANLCLNTLKRTGIWSKWAGRIFVILFSKEKRKHFSSLFVLFFSELKY